MEQWRRSSRYVEEIHKQDLMRYNILDTTKSSATEARNLFGKHWGDIIGTIEEFLTSNPDATSLAPESASALASIDQDIEQDGRADDVKQYIKSILKNVNTAEKLRDVIRIECEKLRENGNTIWRKRVLDLMEILQTEGHYIIKFVSHIFTMLFEDQLFLDCRWGESTLQCSADQLNQSLRDDDRRCTGNKIDAIISMVDFDLEVSTLEVSGSPSCPDHTHYVGDRNKTAKGLKIILNFIKVNYPGDFGEFRRIKVYGVQIYDHDFYIYSMCMPFAGVYYFKLEKKFSYSTIPALLFKELPKFASNLWTMRDMIISSTKSIMSYITNPISESSDDDSKIDKVKTSPRKKKNN
ncbi:2133_t:CDS:2 [Funneliformis caledonium]|uniref:2133_t:CDS:1 n=1 Tax=Funneliformis caledonium TaxID=1117310 RepID=A0A9N9B0K3_9GLOM|nr:2133_t:CDS:2 [Funneliformis caledonium]